MLRAGAEMDSRSAAQVCGPNIDSKYVLRNFYLLYDTSVVVSPPHRFLINRVLERYSAQERELSEL